MIGLSKTSHWITSRTRLVALSVLLLLCRLTCNAQETNAPTYPVGDLLHFFDGSALHGSLKGIDRQNGIQWQHPFADAPIQFFPTNIDEIRLRGAKLDVADSKVSCRFRFADGDEVYGNLRSLDTNAVTMDTRFGKDLRVPRSMMDSITFLSKTFTVLYEGPTNVLGWKMGRAGGVPWQFRDGAFYTDGVGTIGRDLSLPPSCSFEFDLNWTGQFGLIMQLYTENVDRFDYGSGSYIFYFNAASITVQRVSPEMGIASLGQSAQLPAANRRNGMHVEIRANKEDATIAVFIDGALLRRWKDDAGFAAKGTGVLFFCQHEDAPIRISNIKLSDWDGSFEESRTAETVRNEDVLRLANRDRVSGKLGVLRDGKLTFKTPETPLEIPLQRITEVNFSSDRAAVTNRTPWSIRALLSGGEKFTLDLEKWSEQQIAGTNRNFGRVAFPTESVRHLQFNFGQAKGNPDSTNSSNEPWDTALQNMPAANDQHDTLHFRNGDYLIGDLKKYDPAATITWQRDDMIKPAQFKPTAISDIDVHQVMQTAATNDAQVQLVSGDRLQGNLVGLDRDKIVLDTWYGGKMSVARKAVQMVVSQQQNHAVVFNGLTGLDRWSSAKVTAVQDAGEWSYKDGAFFATKAASIARDLHLPDSASIQFDISWRGTLQMAIALYTSRLEPVNLANKDTEPDFGGFYSLQLSSIGSALLVVKKGAPLNYLWPQQMSIPGLSDKNQAHVEVRLDKATHSIALMIDGKIVKQAVDPEGFAGSGTAMRFVHQGLGSLRMSNLRIAEWDGQFEEKYENGQGTQDLVKLRNRDRVSGEVLSVQSGKLIVDATGAKLDVPFERVKQIEFAGQKSDLQKNAETTATGYFRTGGSLSFRIDRWDDAGMAVSNRAFGKAVLNPAVFNRVQLK